jgi:hypothetical protein
LHSKSEPPLIGRILMEQRTLSATKSMTCCGLGEEGEIGVGGC